MIKPVTLCVVAALSLLGACAQMQQGTQQCPPGNCPSLEAVAVPPGSQVTVYTPRQQTVQQTVLQSTTVSTAAVRTQQTIAPAPQRPGILAGYVEYPKPGETVVLNPCGVGNPCPGERRNSVTLDYKNPPSRVAFRYVAKPGYGPGECEKKGGVTEIGPEDRPTCTITKKIVDGAQPMPARISISD